jgi:hypothetical protein
MKSAETGHLGQGSGSGHPGQVSQDRTAREDSGNRNSGRTPLTERDYSPART